MNKTYYEEKIKTLPENLQYAIIMSDWEKSLVDIQKQFNLHIDQTQVLEDLTIKLMFGDIDAPDFINYMFGDAHINSETAADILLEVDLKILKKIRERLESMEQYEQEEAETKEALMDEDIKKEIIESDLSADFYEKIEKITEEANEYNAKIEEENKINEDINQEKESLLSEINTPSKSFTKSLKETIQQSEIKKVDSNTEIVSVDHQIENIHIEKPFKEENVFQETNTSLDQKINPIKISTEINQKPEIKKPITINLDDIYREPLE